MRQVIISPHVTIEVKEYAGKDEPASVLFTIFLHGKEQEQILIPNDKLMELAGVLAAFGYESQRH